MENKLSQKKQITIIVLCWLIYTFAYLGRYSYTSNGVPIKRFYGVGSDEFSLATTFFFFAYGAGQIISGLLCRKYKMRIILPSVLIVSSAINLSIYLGLPFGFIKYLWLINGICQAVLWPSLLRIISCYCEEKNMKFAVLAMSTTVAVGTFLSYGTSALFALTGGFKYSFLLASICMTAVAIVTATLYGKITENLKLENAPIQKSKESENLSGEKVDKRELFKIFVLFGIFAVAINFIKDGLTTWVPHILSERYSVSDSFSMILTLVLPVFGMFGAICAVSLNKAIKEHSDLAGVFFVLSSACIFGIVFLFKTEFWYLILVLFGAVNMLMHGANNVVTSMLPLHIGKKYNAGFVGGVLNGACYVGSTLSQYGIAVIATASNWNTVMRVLAYLCLASSAVALIVKIKRKVQG